MVWGVIGWNFKSLLVFIKHLPGKRGIYNTAYLQQVLEPVVFELRDNMTKDERLEYIFMEDRAKVHKGAARLPRLEKGIRGFD
jgi:hypothetical protein